jgi:hypothetical protein
MTPACTGPTRDLVDLLALDAVEVGDSREERGHGVAGGRRVEARQRRREPHRLEPRVPGRHDGELLGDLALEK